MPATDRPNFLIFVTDEQPGQQLGCDGHPVLQTPHLDQLAADGVRLSRCYTVHPMCMTTRATWFSGRTPRGHGVRCNGMVMDPALPTMTDALRQAGYATHGVGKHHLHCWGTLKGAEAGSLAALDWPEARVMWHSGRVTALPTPYYGLSVAEPIIGNGNGAVGPWTRWLAAQDPDAKALMEPPPPADREYTLRRVWANQLPAELHYDQWMTERTVTALREYAATSQPFFLWHSFPDPHPPYTAPEPWGSMYDPADCPPPNRRDGELDDLAPHFRLQFEQRLLTSGCLGATNIPDDHLMRMRAMTYGMVSHIDHHVGQVLAELDRLGLADHTVVVFMSDHGRCLGDHWMDNMPPAHFDEVLRVPSIWRCPGRFPAGRMSEGLVSHLDFAPTILSLAGVPIPEGPVPPTIECAQQRQPWPGQDLTSLLAGEVEAVQDSVIAELDEDYLGLQLRTLISADHWLTIYGGDREHGELFDLREDPQQLHNRFHDPGYAAVRTELIQELMYRLVETDSVLPRRLCHA